MGNGTRRRQTPSNRPAVEHHGVEHSRRRSGSFRGGDGLARDARGGPCGFLEFIHAASPVSAEGFRPPNYLRKRPLCCVSEVDFEPGLGGGQIIGDPARDVAARRRRSPPRLGELTFFGHHATTQGTKIDPQAVKGVVTEQRRFPHARRRADFLRSNECPLTHRQLRLWWSNEHLGSRLSTKARQERL